MADREPIKIIRDIIKSEMGLEDGQIWIYADKRDIPPDDKLYVVVGNLGTSIIGSGKHYEDDGSGGLNEVQAVNMLGVVSVDILSRSRETRIRAYEVLLALQSTYSVQQQEANGVQIGRLPTAMNDASALEETAYLYRYNFNFNITYKREKIKSVDYFNAFNKQIKTN
jgi:hypothetical protein